jgi:hypothetical protein
MGMFTDFMKKIFVHSPEAENPNAASTPRSAGGPVPGAAPAPQIQTPGAGTPPLGGTPAAVSTVDVGSILDKLAAERSEKLDWKHSIVDMLKLVGMDSSLSARKELADELHYTGDKNDSAAMNIWLHKEVLKKLAANGGRVPADLLD